MTPYSSYHLDSQLDSIQYPLQTLQCLSGDYDDLGLLLCSCLESIQVHTGYIATLDDFIVLVRLEMNPNNVLDNFKSEEGLIIDEESENVYLALSMKNFDKGFKQCFTAGAQAIENCFVDEENYYEFVDVQDAWNSYPPVAYSASIEIPSISETALLKRFDSAINDYIASDIEAAINRARESGDQNKLGLALVRAGRYAEARSAFTKAANTGSVNATILSNLLPITITSASFVNNPIIKRALTNNRTPVIHITINIIVIDNIMILCSFFLSPSPTELPTSVDVAACIPYPGI